MNNDMDKDTNMGIDTDMDMEFGSFAEYKTAQWSL
jgi:hypothetical protein